MLHNIVVTPHPFLLFCYKLIFTHLLIAVVHIITLASDFSLMDNILSYCNLLVVVSLDFGNAVSFKVSPVE